MASQVCCAFLDAVAPSSSIQQQHRTAPSGRQQTADAAAIMARLAAAAAVPMAIGRQQGHAAEQQHATHNDDISSYK